MSNMIIIMKKIKCGDEQKKRRIKITDMLKQPLENLANNSPKKYMFHKGSSLLSMFLQPIDQQYTQNLFEEQTENPNLLGILDLLNYSTDSSEEFQKQSKDCESENLFRREEFIAGRIIPLQAKKGLTSMKELLKNTQIFDKDMVMYNLTNDSLNSTNKSKIIKNKLKLTKLLNSGWDINIPLHKIKSMQKLLFHMVIKKKTKANKVADYNNTKQTTIKISSSKVHDINSINHPSLKSNINFTQCPIMDSNMHIHKRLNSGNNIVNTNNVGLIFDQPLTKNISSNYFKSNYNINIDNNNDNKSIIHNRPNINNNNNFTCNNNSKKVINYFPLKGACEYKHNLKLEGNIINKIKYRRPLSVD